MKVPLVLQRTLDSAVSVGTRIGLRKKTASNANDDEDEIIESGFTTREILRSMDSVAVYRARIQRSKEAGSNKGHYRTSCSTDDSEMSSTDIAMVSAPAEDYQYEDGLRGAGSRECQGPFVDGHLAEVCPIDRPPTITCQKSSDAHVTFVRVETPDVISATVFKSVASRRLRDGIAPYLFNRPAKQDIEDGEDPVSLPQRVDSVDLTHRRLSLASPGHYGGGGTIRKREVRRNTFSLAMPSLMQRQSIQQVSGSIRAVGRRLSSTFVARPKPDRKASMLARETARPAVPSALKSGSRDQPLGGSSTSRRLSVHFDSNLDNPSPMP
ncbi:hypothetical protein COCOBI_14-3610 [Coccomyxa sp. Obi]|nr:hypothetical protein COCOBI_14-3610 [Coccomyxa sp. Obi]